MASSLLHRCRFIILLHLLAAAAFSAGESPTCLTVYREGGAPAVFQSPKCPRWKLSNYDPNRPPPRATNCQSAMLQGRRRSQEDRILCALDVRIPFPGPYGLTEVLVGIVAVFDGHNGAEASDMASKLLMEYLVLHTYFLLDATFASLLKKPIGRLTDNNNDNFLRDRDQNFFDQSRFKITWPEDYDSFFHLEILKESLLMAINDIDATFSKEASKYNLDSGSTATVILIADGQILVANLGDSKALICSENDLSPAEAKAILLRLCQQKRRNGLVTRFKECGDLEMMASSGLTYLSAKELTRDHHPDRDDEKSRVEKSGGYVVEWGGVPRINGQLAISRAIGDVPYKSYGVSSAPEVTDWQPLTANDSYLVAASDGVFETLDAQDVCDLLWEAQNENPLKSKFSPACSYSLADCVVNTAFDKGSTDNIASVVVPLNPIELPNTFYDERYTENRGILSSFPKSQEAIGQAEYYIRRFLTGELSPALVHLEHAQPLAAKLDELLVEAKHGSFSCFYLSENLKENEDYKLRVLEDGKEENNFDSSHALLPDLESGCSGSLNLYNERSLCLHFGTNSVGDQDHSLYPESFVKFFGLLESIPFYVSGSNFGSFEHVKPSMRYVLNKRFGRGAYGEVWLAFHWNCTLDRDVSSWNKKNRSSSKNEESLPMNRSNHDCNGSFPADNMFILKRIMVEKGAAVYMSGLREKYFGALFLNASAYLRGPSSASAETEDSEILENQNVERNTTDGAYYEEGLSHVARYVESFESRSNEIWLVFRHEGISLSKLMYTAEEVKSNVGESESERVGNAQILNPSEWWHWLKTTEAGQGEMRNLIRQLLLALKSCHDRNITHRDIKPENMVICFEDPETGRCMQRSPDRNTKHAINMRLIDFGSAIDDFTVKHLYNSAGPTRAEQTFEYTPPEALLNSTWHRGPTSRTLKYDMWSVGVVILELILGSPDVFQINTLSRALLDKHIAGWNEDLKELAYKLRSFMEMCILITGSPSKLHHNRRSPYGAGVSPASWKCSEEFFSNLIKTRDPLMLGFPDVQVMRLVRQLLLWDPDDRLSVDEALQHPYFQSSP